MFYMFNILIIYIFLEQNCLIFIENYLFNYTIGNTYTIYLTLQTFEPFKYKKYNTHN